MSEKILGIYESILDYAGMKVHEDGSIYWQLTSTNSAEDVLINGERLVMPIRSQFDDPDQANKIYFHPFAEMFTRGPSEVIERLNHYIVMRIDCTIGMLANYLLELLGSSDHHKRLNEDQIALLKQISKADASTGPNWSDLMLKLMRGKTDTVYYKLYLKISGTWKGESYSRLGIATFPFYQDIVQDTKYEKLRKADKDSFRKIMEFMFPDIKTPEAYNYGTRTRTAPFLDALMHGSALTASRLNELILLYREFIPGYEELLFNTEWVEAFQDLDALSSEIRKMPDLKGNLGSTTVQERKHPQQEVQQQVHQPQPVAQAPAQVMQPAPVVHQQHQPVAAQPVAGIPVTAEGKIRFSDVLRSNPVVAHAPNPLAHEVHQQAVDAYVRQYGVLPPPGYGMPPPPQAPGWAAPQMPQQGHYPQHPGYAPMPQQIPQQLPPPPPGYQYVPDQMGRPILVPIQMQPTAMMPQPSGYGHHPGFAAPAPMHAVQNGNPPPPGWAWRR